MNKITIETSFYLLVANLSQNYGSFQTLYRTSQKKVSKKVILIWKSHFTTRNKIKKTHYYTCLENVHETRGVYILVSFVPRSDVFMLKHNDFFFKQDSAQQKFTGLLPLPGGPKYSTVFLETLIPNRYLRKPHFRRKRSDHFPHMPSKSQPEWGAYTLMAKSQCSLAVVSCSMCLSTSATERLQLLFFLQQTTFSSPVSTLCSSEFRSLQLSVSEGGHDELSRQVGNGCSPFHSPWGTQSGKMEWQWSLIF